MCACASCNLVLDMSFSVEESEFVVLKLNCGKGSGADDLQAEHLKYGGHLILLWIQCIFNAIIQLEQYSALPKVGCNCTYDQG